MLIKEMAPQVLAHPGARPTTDLEVTVDTIKDTAPATHPATECFACYEGLVYIGYLVEDDETGETSEVFEPVPCRHCRPASR